jgi:hypothetical protein
VLHHRDTQHLKNNHIFVDKSENQPVLKTEYLNDEAGVLAEIFRAFLES